MALTWRIAIATVAVLAVEGAAIGEGRACSVVGGPMDAMLPPADGLTLGPIPVLLSAGTSDGYLTAEGSDEFIPMVEVDLFEGVAFRSSGEIHAWRPAEPLPAGAYEFFAPLGAPSGSTVTFFVDPSIVEPTPALERADFHVLLDDPDEDERSSCVGDGDSCDDIDFSRLTIELVADEAVAGALVELTFPASDARHVVFSGGPPRAVAASADADRREVSFMDSFGGLPASFKKTRVCVALTPIGEGGAVGERVDLGCARPDDDDPRVTDRRGCVSRKRQVATA